MICISCGIDLEEGTRYCPVCATQQPPPRPEDLASDSSAPKPIKPKTAPFTVPMGDEELEDGVLSEDSTFFPDQW